MKSFFFFFLKLFIKVSELWTPPLVWWLRLLLKNAFFLFIN